MKAKKVIVFNGPPSSGKDLFGGLIYKALTKNGHRETFVQSFKETLVNIAIAIANVDKTTWTKWYTQKELKRSELWNMSCREFLINISEELIKPNFDRTYFGDMLAKRLNFGVNIITDGGFKEELEPIIKEVGVDNVLIFRLHRDGCTFKGDSRGWIEDFWFDGMKCIDINSKGHQETLNVIMPHVVKFITNGPLEKH